MDWYTTLDEQVAAYLPDLTYLKEEPMSRHTSFRIGGPARLMACPSSGTEAAALLRRVGVDTADVQRLFQGTLSDMIERYDIIRHAELYHNDIAIAAVEQDIDRVTAAKAADELLTLRGVRASFVLFKHDTGVNLSARSLGEINVQLIMEKLGGGGNSTTAGGQIPDGTVDAVREQLIAAIDQYLEG